VAGKVTVGLASHWPSVTDFTHGLDREMRTTPTLSCGVWPIYLLPVHPGSPGKGPLNVYVQSSHPVQGEGTCNCSFHCFEKKITKSLKFKNSGFSKISSVTVIIAPVDQSNHGQQWTCFTASPARPSFHPLQSERTIA